MQLIKMSRRRRQCGITQTLIRVFVRGHETRAAHPSSQPSIPLFSLSLLLYLHCSSLAFAWQPHFLARLFPACPRHRRQSSATFHPTLSSLHLPFPFSVSPHRSHQQLTKQVRLNIWDCNRSNLCSPLSFTLISILCCHIIPSVFITAPGRISSALSLSHFPVYMLTNTHTH